MKQYRKHAVIGILALSALITPPDVVTQFLIGIPLFILYEISIGIARRGEKQYQKDLE
jgi:sec-independent protein translocase protein TatC